jgi:hypothetical protein
LGQIKGSLWYYATQAWRYIINISTVAAWHCQSLPWTTHSYWRCQESESSTVAAEVLSSAYSCSVTGTYHQSLVVGGQHPLQPGGTPLSVTLQQLQPEQKQRERPEDLKGFLSRVQVL